MMKHNQKLLSKSAKMMKIIDKKKKIVKKNGEEHDDRCLRECATNNKAAGWGVNLQNLDKD